MAAAGYDFQQVKVLLQNGLFQLRLFRRAAIPLRLGVNNDQTAFRRVPYRKGEVVYDKRLAAEIKQGDGAAIRQGECPVVRCAIPVRICQIGERQPLRLEIAGLPLLIRRWAGAFPLAGLGDKPIEIDFYSGNVFFHLAHCFVDAVKSLVYFLVPLGAMPLVIIYPVFNPLQSRPDLGRVPNDGNPQHNRARAAQPFRDKIKIGHYIQ